MRQRGAGSRRADDLQFRRRHLTRGNRIQRGAGPQRIPLHDLVDAFGDDRIAHGIHPLVESAQLSVERLEFDAAGRRKSKSRVAEWNSGRVPGRLRRRAPLTGLPPPVQLQAVHDVAGRQRLQGARPLSIELLRQVRTGGGEGLLRPPARAFLFQASPIEILGERVLRIDDLLRGGNRARIDGAIVEPRDLRQDSSARTTPGIERAAGRALLVLSRLSCLRQLLQARRSTARGPLLRPARRDRACSLDPPC